MIVSKLLKNIKFFRERDIVQEHELVEITLTMLLEQFEENQMVFDHGELGDKFYIILQGQVGVDIPVRIPVSSEIKIARK